jgi:hypothetical protein
VADEALATLGELAPNDTTVTEALFALGRRGDVRALSTLSRRSPAQLQPLVPRLLTWLASEDKDRDDAALVLGGLADTAPRDVAIALAVRLAGLNRRDSRDERKYHVMLDALRRLGRAALPALRQIKTAARHPDQRIRDDASTLVATLRAVEP